MIDVNLLSIANSTFIIIIPSMYYYSSAMQPAPYEPKMRTHIWFYDNRHYHDEMTF